MDFINKINCPVCTFLNNSNNTYCELCDNILVEGNIIINNPLEDEFMQLTGESRIKAKEYLGVTSNNLDKAVSFYYEDKDRGISNADYINNNEIINIFMQFINSSLSREYKKPTNIKELTCQILYSRGRNTPHHCELCNSRAFLLCAKILSYQNSVSDIIRLISQEDLNELEITSDKYNDLVKDIIENIKTVFLPDIIIHLITYIKDAYFNRNKFLSDNKTLEWIENYIDRRNGMEFRIIWDTLHQNNDKLEEDKISETLNSLVESIEFHSYLNQSWESPVYNHPASQEALANLKKVNLTKECKELENFKGESCAICMEDFIPDGREIIMLKCHSFCSACILQWLENHNDTCPVCRKTVGEPVQKKQKTEHKKDIDNK